MRVLHLTDSGGIYGAESVILNLMEEHSKMGLKPALMSFGSPDEGVKDVEREVDKLGLDLFRCCFEKGRPYKSAAEIVKVANDFDAHILHSHNYKGNILVGLISPKNRKIPVVATLHGWTHTSAIRKIMFYNLLDAFMMKRLDQVVVVSEEMRKKCFLRLAGIDPIVIPNGIRKLDFDYHRFERECPAIVKQCRPERTKLLAIGRLSPEKGFDVLIRSVSTVNAAGHDFILVFIGEGPQKDHLVSLARDEGIANRVHFIGYREKAFQYIPFFDTFIISSLTEGLPITLLEAMQAGVPVIATSVGEIPKVLNDGEYGRLVPPGDAAILSKAIEEMILEKDVQRKKAQRSKKWVREEYGIHRMARLYAEVYHKLKASCQVSSIPI